MSGRLCTEIELERLAASVSFKTGDMAALLGVGQRQMQRIFLKEFGKSPAEWLRDLKCRRAKELLAQGYHTDEAAREAGFASASHLCHEFKRVFGAPPQSFSPVGRKFPGATLMSP